MSTLRILVTGATGYIGSRLIGRLLDEGHQVVAASRNRQRLADFGWHDRVQTVSLDAHDEDSVRQAFEQCGPVDVVYYLVHGIGQPGFRESDNRAAATVAAASKQAGVSRIVYLGGFVPDGDALSEHLTSRAEVAAALHVDGGPDVVWLGAAIIIGAGSTSFEMLRYVGDRFLLLPLPDWSANPIDPISVSDALYYLAAAADTDTVPAGAYDIRGPETTTYGDLLRSYARIAGIWRTPVPVIGIDTGLVSRVTGLVLPVPGGLAADLVESLDYPMMASQDGLAGLVPQPAGGLVSTADAIRRAVKSPRPRPVDQLADPHHLADTDPNWAGGDALRLKNLAGCVTPSIARPLLDLIGLVPKPVAAAVRTGLDTVLDLIPKAGTA
ncbi:NAD(P)H-binding protein [Mycobacterium sp. SMC-4]|uniref:NAD(P)H-binding protein n=1 Tax=Mycobacterium sp. SMC-4 TaxID=2857059 RepID=UPI0021B2C483|nr:NAD(P)H-binding protein [Mycobacterium sp. SMC-4]UXA16883.1 NAD(P)H-binding protein [Mycobacterium sp. SMC-4]